MNILRHKINDESAGGLSLSPGHNVRLDRIEHVAIDVLKRFDRNVRKRGDTGRAALVSSVSRFGLVLPILVDTLDRIIAGEGIVEAAKTIGYTEVPVIRADHLSDGDARLLRIALNKLGETSEWDRIELAAEISDLLSIDIDLDLEVTGFTSIEVDTLLHGTGEAEVEEDEPIEVGEPGTAVTRLGDIYDLNRHSVLCGSSLEPDNLALIMAGALARMVLIDLPYNLKILGFVSGLVKNKHREFAAASGELSEDEFIAFLTTSICSGHD